MESIDMVQSITAAMSLRLPGTVGKIANKMRYIDEKAPLFTQGGLIRSIPRDRYDLLHAVGIASKSSSLPAFGGMLYGAAALRHDVVVADGKVTDTYQDSRVDVSDMNFLDAAQRLTWKEYVLSYQLLEDLFAEPRLPHLILLRLPLLVIRAEQSVSLEDEDVREEWQAVMQVMERFWSRNLRRCFPQDPEGPIIASVGRRYFGAVLNAIRAQGPDGTPEEITQALVDLVTQEWTRLREVGIMRTLRGFLKAGRRTIAYYYRALGSDILRAQPRILSAHGLLGFHMQVGYRTPIWQIETIGEPGSWTTADLDRLASLIQYLTLYDNPKASPLPLWYAANLGRMPKEVLVNYMKETLNMLRDQSVERAWLEGIEALEEGE